MVFAVFSPTFGFPFVNWDDGEYVYLNTHVTTGLGWDSLRYAFTNQVAGNWHPVTVLSHIADVELFGMDAGGHHAVSVILHAASTVALFLLLRSSTRSTGRSAFVAALFAVHPLHVESVAWVSERKDVLSTLFAVLTMAEYCRYVRRRTWGRYCGSLALFCLALLCKPMVVTLPALLLLFDVWPLRRLEWPGDAGGWRELVREKVPFLGAAAATGVVALATQGHALAAFDALPWSARLSNAIYGYGFYLSKTLWPAPLAAFYPMSDHSAITLTGVVLVFTLFTVAAVRLARRVPFVVVGWLWFVIALLPVAGFIQVGEQAAADRYMYFPLVGLGLIAAWNTELMSDRWRRVAPALAVAVILACGLTARSQVWTWADSGTLWRHAVEVIPRNYRAYENLGQTQRDARRFDDARKSYEQALALTPAGFQKYRSILYNSIGIVDTAQGRTGEALMNFKRSVQLDSRFAEAQNNLGAALAQSGRLDEAAQHFLEAKSLTPGSAETLIGLAGVRLTQGRAAEAMEIYSSAVALGGDRAEAHAGVGAAAAALGQYDRASVAFRKALDLKPAMASARVRLANLLARAGQIDQAIQELQTAITVESDQPSWHYALAALLLDRNRPEEARRELEATLALQPGHSEAQRALLRLKK